MIIDSAVPIDSNVKGAVEFGFGATASKIFSMLSTGLYTNKEVAVLHELGANALDAHKLLGKEDVPFEIVFPTSLDNHLRVRDFGPGLSEEDVYRFLTNFGESSKQDSNSMIGGWGIGSKSPVAVTSTWNILSKHQGQLKEYLVFVNDESVPSLILIRTEDCDPSETGLEVVIPVRPSNFNIWKYCVESVFRHYQVKPELKNIDRFTWLRQTDSYFNSPTKYHFNPGSRQDVNYIVVNQREYSIDRYKISNELDKFGDCVGSELLNVFPLHFSTGEIDLTLSREGIQYTKKTIQSFKRKLEECQNFLNSKAKEINDLSTDEFDYRKRISETFSSTIGGSNSEVYSSLIGGNKYGLKVNDLRWVSFDVDSKLFEDSCLQGLIDCVPKSMNKLGSLIQVNKSDYDHTAQCYLKHHVRVNILAFTDPGFKFQIVIDDVPDTFARIRYSDKRGYCLRVKNDLFPAKFDHFKIKASDMDKRPKMPRNSRPANVTTPKQEIFQFNGNVFRRLDSSTKVPENAVWVIIKHANDHTLNRVKYQFLTFAKQEYIVLAVKSADQLPKDAIMLMDQLKKDYDDFTSSGKYERSVNAGIYDFNNYDRSIDALLTEIVTKRDSLWNDIGKKFIEAKGYVIDNDFTKYQTYERIMDLPAFYSDNSTIDPLDSYRTTLYNTYEMLEFVDIPGTWNNGKRQKFINALTEYLEKESV